MTPPAALWPTENLCVCATCELVCHWLPFSQTLSSYAVFGRNAGDLLCLAVCRCVRECVFYWLIMVMLPGLQYVFRLSFTRPGLQDTAGRLLLLMGHPWQLNPSLPPCVGVVQHTPQFSLPFPTFLHPFLLSFFPFFSAVRAASDGRTQFHNAVLWSPVAQFDKTVSLHLSDGLFHRLVCASVDLICVRVCLWECIWY